jgi:hypothetical protein
MLDSIWMICYYVVLACIVDNEIFECINRPFLRTYLYLSMPFASTQPSMVSPCNSSKDCIIGLKEEPNTMCRVVFSSEQCM